MQTTYYPMDFITRGATRLLEARDIDGGVVDYLRSLKINQVAWRDRFTLRPPDANERSFFGLSDQVQVAVLDVRRTSYDQKGKPIRVTVTIYAGDRNQFEMEAGKPPPPTVIPPLPSTPPTDADTEAKTQSPPTAETDDPA
jgi:GntR family transcriptional regulator